MADDQHRDRRDDTGLHGCCWAVPVGLLAWLLIVLAVWFFLLH